MSRRREPRKPGWRVWFHRSRAAAWVLVGAASFPLGLANNIALVWLASVYANTVSDWGAAEAADDTELLARLDAADERAERIGEQLGRVEGLLTRLLERQ